MLLAIWCDEGQPNRATDLKSNRGIGNGLIERDGESVEEDAVIWVQCYPGFAEQCRRDALIRLNRESLSRLGVNDCNGGGSGWLTGEKKN